MAARTVLVDTGFLVALIDERDRYHGWAATQGSTSTPPWLTCEAVLSEAFFLLGREGAPVLMELLRRSALLTSFDFGQHQAPVLALMKKYADVPMSLADACLVRMSEISADSLIVTIDSDFRLYRRNSREIVPCILPD